MSARRSTRQRRSGQPRRGAFVGNPVAQSLLCTSCHYPEEAQMFPSLKTGTTRLLTATCFVMLSAAACSDDNTDNDQSTSGETGENNPTTTGTTGGAGGAKSTATAGRGGAGGSGTSSTTSTGSAGR